MMQWERLLSDKRVGMEHYHQPKQSAQPWERTDFERDYDRMVFSSPFRRLQNKAQVFPLQAIYSYTIVLRTVSK